MGNPATTTVDVPVIGAGPTGVGAATAPAAGGAHRLLLDTRPRRRGGRRRARREARLPREAGATPSERAGHTWTSLRGGSVEHDVLWLVVDLVICSVVVSAATWYRPRGRTEGPEGERRSMTVDTESVDTESVDAESVDTAAAGLRSLVAGPGSARQAGGDLRVARPSGQVRTAPGRTDPDRGLRPAAGVQDASGAA